MAYANFLLECSVGFKLMWPMLIVNMRISMGFRKLPWHANIGIFIVARISIGAIEVVALFNVAY